MLAKRQQNPLMMKRTELMDATLPARDSIVSAQTRFENKWRLTDSKESNMQERQEEEGDPNVASVDAHVCLLRVLIRDGGFLRLGEAALDNEPCVQCKAKCTVEEAFVREAEDDEGRSEGGEKDQEALEEGLVCWSTVESGDYGCGDWMYVKVS